MTGRAPSPYDPSSLRIIAGAGIIALGTIGYVIIAIFVTSEDATAIRGSFLFLIAPGGALLTAGLTEPALNAIQRRTEKIEKQTNGILTGKIENAVNRAANQASAKDSETIKEERKSDG